MNSVTLTFALTTFHFSNENMNEPEILHTLLDRLRAAVNIEQSIKNEYEKLVNNVPEHGFEQLYPLDTMSDEQENAIRDLRKLGYLEAEIQYHNSDGHYYHIDLRSDEYNKFIAEECKKVEKQEVTEIIRGTSDMEPHPEYVSPFAIERLAVVLSEGAKKHGLYNYMNGTTASRIMAALHRHLMKYQQGNDQEDHLAHLAANVMLLLHIDECCKRGILPDSLLDLPKYSEIPRVHFINNDLVEEDE